MLVSYQWLCEMVDLEGVSAEDIADKLNHSGIEVDKIHLQGNGVAHVLVGRVVSVRKHPEADRLRVCSVDVGEEALLQIVCGASNVGEGQLVPVAVVGATLPGDFKIKKAKLRGVESFGMICSGKELGIQEKYLTKEQTEGILVLDEDATIGQDVCEYLGLSDPILDLDLTPNRSDCLGMKGVAYEVSAILNRPLRPGVAGAVLFMEEDPDGVQIRMDHAEDCSLYVGRMVKNLRTDVPTPQWMKNRLISAGIRPVHVVVDITNYVMLETGQPLHAFDLSKIHDRSISITRAFQGERVITLDGMTRVCDQGTILIKTAEDVIAIAGIMGAKNAEVTSHTTDVFIESAVFNPAEIRRSSRKLGLRSEASSRFEKGVDPDGCVSALARAIELLRQILMGESGATSVGGSQIRVEDNMISLRHQRIHHVLGIDIRSDEVLELFRRLHFPVICENEVYHVQVPIRRPDITIEVDLIEEVARLYGYDRIPTTLPRGRQTSGRLTKEQRVRRIIRHTLRNLGISEVATYTLTSDKAERMVGSSGVKVAPIRIMTPLSQERSVLRTNLLPHLMETVRYNLRQGQKEVSLFEMSRLYRSFEASVTGIPEENWEVAGAVTEARGSYFWEKGNVDSVFYNVKGYLTALFSRIGIDEVKYSKVSVDGFHPGRTAHISIRGVTIGLIGELHPKKLKEMDLPKMAVFQLDLTSLCQKIDQFIYTPFARFPSMSRDIALIVDEKIPARDIENEIRNASSSLLESVSVFDVFSGNQVEDGKKSIAFSLVYRAPDRTLTEEEVQQVHQEIVTHLDKEVSAKQRD